MKLKEVLDTKNKIHDKIKSIIDFSAIWEYNSETKLCKLIIEGTYMKKDKKQSGLTDSDKEWIANLIVTAVKPINQRLTNIENRLENVENRLIKIENCPTIKKEIK